MPVGGRHRNTAVYFSKMLHRREPECPVCLEPFDVERDVTVCRICCESMCAEHFSKRGGISICPVCRDSPGFST